MLCDNGCIRNLHAVLNAILSRMFCQFTQFYTCISETLPNRILGQLYLYSLNKTGIQQEQNSLKFMERYRNGTRENSSFKWQLKCFMCTLCHAKLQETALWKHTFFLMIEIVPVAMEFSQNP